MNPIGWQEIAVRLIFAFILGGATAIARRWYQTKQLTQSNTLMALGAAMFSILASLTSNKFSYQSIVAISIVCAGISFLKRTDSQNISTNTVMRLWCAGAVGSMVGFGFFVPAYVSILIVILANLLFPASETDFTPYTEKESNNDSESKTELEQTAKLIVPQETYHQCQVNCLAKDEAKVLALLVQLGKEQNLTPTKISSKNLANDSALPKIEIRVNFISDSDRDPLRLQQILMSLKSELDVSSVSWLDLPPE